MSAAGMESSSARFGLWRFALVYVPENCKDHVESCRIHVNYHGALAELLGGKGGW